MVAFNVTVILLLGSVVAVAIFRKSKMPMEVILLIGSLFVGMLPLPSVRLQPEVAFAIFLPPILFASAYFTSWNEFVRNIRPISFLAVGLVVFTMSGVALVAKYFAPQLAWPQAFLLGAIVAPPDASAAVALIRGFRLPRRLVTIIEGESLINDATALTCFKVALAVLASGVFNLSDAVLEFGKVSVGGAIVGTLLAFIALRLMRLVNNPSGKILTSMLTPFICYGAAEHLHFSGVISTVVAGILFGRRVPVLITSQGRILAKGAWDVLLYSVNALVFTFIGLQLPLIVAGHTWKQLIDLGCASILITALLIALRFIWIFFIAHSTRALIPSVRRTDPIPNARVLVLLSWCGMRGIVTLASALAVPLVISEGKPFPFRNEMLFVSYGVAVLTLLIPSFTLSWLLKHLNLELDNEHQRDESTARMKMTEAVIARLGEWRDASGEEREILHQFLDRYSKFKTAISPNLSDQPYTELHSDSYDVRQLVLKLVSIERAALADLRRSGTIHDEVFHQLSEELDYEEMRLSSTVRATLFLPAVVRANSSN